MSQTWIYTHTDADGLTAGALLLRQFPGSEVFFTRPVSLDTDLEQINPGDRLYISDIAISKVEKEKIFAEITRIGSDNVVFIDHHPSSKENPPPCKWVIKEGMCAAELVYHHFYGDKMEPVAARIASMGIIGDQFLTPFLDRVFLYLDRRQIYLEAGILVYAVAALGCKDYDTRREFVQYLAEGGLPSQHREMVRLAMKEAEEHEEKRRRVYKIAKRMGPVAYVINPRWSLGVSAFYAAARHDVPIGIGFMEEREKTELSVRVRNKKYNIRFTVERVAEKLGGSGGGHPVAAGGRLPGKSALKFVKEFIQDITKRYPELLQYMR